jgi:hypothetical protein
MRIPIGKERTVVKVDPPPFEGGARASYQAEQFLVEEPPEVVKERAADLFRREWRYGGQWGYGRNYVWLQGANMGWFSLLFRDQENAAVAFVREGEKTRLHISATNSKRFFKELRAWAKRIFPQREPIAQEDQEPIAFE